MKRARILSIALLCLCYSCSQNKSSNQAQDETQGTEINGASAKTKFKSFEEYSIYFHGLFDNKLGDCSIDQYGNISLDNGSMSAGRGSFRITDVDIRMEEKPEEPGCADVCPPRVVIYLDCKKNGECISDTGLEMKTKSAVFVYSVKMGKMAFDFLVDFKKFITSNL